MNIVLNGRPVDVPDNSLARLLGFFEGSTSGPLAQGRAVAVNGVVLPRSAHAEHCLQTGDVVDVVSAVPGG